MLLDEGQRRNALTVLTRLAADEPAARGTLSDAVRRGLPLSLSAAVDVALHEGHPMSDVLSELAGTASIEIVTDLWEQIPAETTALRGTAVTALARLTSTASLPEDAVTAVSMLIDRAERMVELGVHTPSSDIARQAIERLAVPDHPTPALAALAPQAWRVMSRCQMMTGDNDGAVASARLALRLTKIMCWDAPCLTVAAAHGTLGWRLFAAERYAEARDQFETSMVMAGRLLEDPAWYRPEPGCGPPWAMVVLPKNAIQAYALARAGLAGRWGFDPERTYYREPTRPTAIVDVISTTLTGLCQCLDRLGDPAGAANATERAVALMRDLCDADPDRHRGHLGVALMLLADQFVQLDRHAESLRAAEEAVELLRKAVLDSGGGFVDEYAQALTVLIGAMAHVGDTTIGTVVDRAEELVLLFESARGTEAHDRGRTQLTFISQALDNLARAAERLGDPETALGMAAIVIRGVALLRGIDVTADNELARAVNLRSRLLASLGRTEEAIAAAEDAVSHADGTVRLLMLNNLAKRLLDAGDRKRARTVAEEGLALLDATAIKDGPGDHGSWWLAVSLLGVAVKDREDPPPDHNVEILMAVLASAPSPPAEEIVEEKLPNIAILMYLALREKSPVQAMEILERLATAESRAGLPAGIRAHYAISAQQLVCLLADSGRPETAASVYRLLAGVARSSGEEIPRIEQAKAATEVMQAFINAQRYHDARDIAADAQDVLRSRDYLAARERDLGQKPREFLKILDQLLGR